MDAWDLPEAFAVVSGNAANVVLALNSSDRVGHVVRCIGHTSQLAINDSLKAFQIIMHALAAMRSVAKFFRRSGPGWNKLEEVQWREIQENNMAELPGSRMKPLRPIMDCETRWNSKIAMAERMVELQGT